MYSSNWEAISLLARIKKEEERLYGRTLPIFFTSNTMGHIGPVISGDRSLGGLARRQAKLKELKLLYKHSLVLDAGMVTSGTKTQQFDSVLYKAYGEIFYDAVNLGSNELTSRPKILVDAHKMFRIPWISSNVLSPQWGKSVMGHKEIKTNKGIKVRILGLMDPSNIRQKTGRTYRTADMVTRIKESRLKWKEEPHLFIIMLNGAISTANSLAQNIPGIDVIILSGEKKATEKPVINGKTLILCPGSQGTHIGYLNLRFSKDFKIESYSHERIALDSRISPDPSLQAILAKASVLLDSLEMPVKGDDGYYSRTLPFVRSKDSSRGGDDLYKGRQNKL
ncbi:hypothetical protein ACFL5V_13110 [Fibrobacterota bacterium]